MLKFLANFLDVDADHRTDRVDCQIENECLCAIGDGLHHRDDLVGVDVGKRPGKDIDAAAARFDARHLQIAERKRLLRREPDPQIAAAVIAALLPGIGNGPGDIGRAAHAREKAVELARDVSRRGVGADQRTRRSKANAGFPFGCNAHQKSLPGLTLVRVKMRAITSSSAMTP